MKNLACLNFIKLNNISGIKDHTVKNTLNFDFDFIQNIARQAINKIKNINDRIELLKLSIRRRIFSKVGIEAFSNAFLTWDNISLFLFMYHKEGTIKDIANTISNLFSLYKKSLILESDKHAIIIYKTKGKIKITYDHLISMPIAALMQNITDQNKFLNLSVEIRQ